MIVPTYNKMLEIETMLQRCREQGFRVVADDGSSVALDYPEICNLCMAFEGRFFNQTARAELHRTVQNNAKGNVLPTITGSKDENT